jgi:hypothetical protein
MVTCAESAGTPAVYVPRESGGDIMATKRSERAFQAWPLLTFAAERHQLLTYEELGLHLGLPSLAVGPDALGPISRYCRKKGLPFLNLIVVGKKTGSPKHDVGKMNVPSEQAKVFNYGWIDRKNHAKVIPRIDDFEKL